MTAFRAASSPWALAGNPLWAQELGPVLVFAVADPDGHPPDLGALAVLDVAAVEELHAAPGALAFRRGGPARGDRGDVGGGRVAVFTDSVFVIPVRVGRREQKSSKVLRRACRLLSLHNGMTAAMEHKKIGRPSKGDRRLVNYKLPVPLIEAVREYARDRGMTVTDLVGELLAAEVGVPYQMQEGLPLNKAS